MQKRFSWILVLGLVITACGDDDPTPASGDGGTSSGVGAAGGGKSDAGAGPAGDAGVAVDGAAPDAGPPGPDGGALPSDILSPGPVPGSSGVTGSKPIAQISDAEAEQLCLFENAVFKANLKSRKAYCLSNIWEDCQNELGRCLGSSEPEDARDEDWQCELATVQDYFDGDTCTATVAEFETCVKAQEASEQAFFAAAECPAFGEPEQPPLAQGCEALALKCPDLL